MQFKEVILPDGKKFDFWEKETVYSSTLYVSQNDPNASDDNNGSEAAPFKTIQAAADKAVAGTHIIIGPGEYHECVSPKAGGNGPDSMICYEAANPGTVIIKASEVVTDFSLSEDWRRWNPAYPEDKKNYNMKIWSHSLDPDMFRGYNPFCAVNILHDRLFIEYDKTDMTPYLNRRGMIFCDGKPLVQVPLYSNMSDKDGTYWVEANGQTVHFRLPGDENPKNHKIEITVREQCFAPKTPFLSYIKVKGLICAHAAMGAPVPQRGAISAYRGHHWIIEDCTVDWANAVAIDVGNECWHHNIDFDRVAGYSIIRRCHIKDAGVCGIAGLFAKNMLVEDNLINREIAGEILSTTQAAWDAAENGRQAVDCFTASPAGTYSLILMDIQMPVLDGYAAARAIRASGHEDASVIPIYAMTANTFAEDVAKALAAGMNGHLAKPIDMNALMRVLSSIR